MLTNERIAEIGDELDAEPNRPHDTLLWNQEFAKRILKEAKTEVYDLGYQDGHMTATAQFNTDEHINRIKALAIVDAVNAHPELIAYLQHTGQTRTNGVRHEIWLSSIDLINYANKLRGEK